MRSKNQESLWAAVAAHRDHCPNRFQVLWGVLCRASRVPHRRRFVRRRCCVYGSRLEFHEGFLPRAGLPLKCAHKAPYVTARSVPRERFRKPTIEGRPAPGAGGTRASEEARAPVCTCNVGKGKR